MKGLELLETFPKTAIVVKQWYLEKMLDSLQNKDIPEDFKEAVRAKGIDNENIGTLIDTSPRNLFDVFDDHKVFIQINVYSASSSFSYLINEGDIISGPWHNRKEAEMAAIVESFKLLEEKL